MGGQLKHIISSSQHRRITMVDILVAVILILFTTESQGQQAICSELASPDNGQVTYSPVSAPILVDTRATYSCEDGYLLSGGTVRNCGFYGNWSGEDITCQLPGVYISHGPVNYPLNNSQIPISSLGENSHQTLVCHTDSTDCCRGVDNPFDVKGKANWLFPNGTEVQRSLDVEESETNLLYRSRDFRLIRLHHRGDVVSPTGLYCCEIPRNGSNTTYTFCVELVTCGAPPSIANGSPGTPTSSSTGGTVVYSCEPEFILVGGATSTCLSSGSWTTPPSCQTPPPVYLSLSTTNHISPVLAIPLSSVGEGRGKSLVCHTEGGTSNWYYPDGSVVTETGDWYVVREGGSVSLNRRMGVQSPSGTYCCFVTSHQETQALCAFLVSQTGETDNFIVIVGGAVGGGALLIVCLTVIIVTAMCLAARQKKTEQSFEVVPKTQGSSHKETDVNDAWDELKASPRYSSNVSYGKTPVSTEKLAAKNPINKDTTEAHEDDMDCEEIYDDLRC